MPAPRQHPIIGCALALAVAAGPVAAAPAAEVVPRPRPVVVGPFIRQVEPSNDPFTYPEWGDRRWHPVTGQPQPGGGDFDLEALGILVTVGMSVLSLTMWLTRRRA